MQEYSYPARFEQTEDGDWWVEFPDLPGCCTWGGSESIAKANAAAALTGHLKTQLDLNRSFATPSEMEMIQPDTGFLILITGKVPLQSAAY